MNKLRWRNVRYLIIVMLCTSLLVVAVSALASPRGATQGNWWDVEPELEVPSPYYDSILYSEIAPKLREIEVNSNRVKVDVIGQSAGGRNLFLVTLSAPEAMGRLGEYQAIRNTMLNDPEKAQAMIDKFGDFKVPVFINGSIHGNEYPGVDAAIRLIETLAYEDSEEVQAILENVILLVNIVQNPDGRVLGTRRNSAGFDLNRDFITQSQPETRATVKVLTEWNPMVVLDLHGFVTPMLIEPCTPPHNPNYEYDLYIKWALDEARAMEAELLAQTGLPAQIPYRDFTQGWDDWPPIFVPMYAMYHGSYGHTLETPDRRLGEVTVDAHYAAVWGALNFVAENREGMIRDQVEIFKRGFLDAVQVPIPEEYLEGVPEQYNDLTTVDFPSAYVIPADTPLQQSPYEAARLVDWLLFNDIQVSQANQTFILGGVEYPKGSYVVWMDQPKRGLANTVLWAGWDISYDPGLTMYDISGWSHPLLWGVTRVAVEDELDVGTLPVQNASRIRGSLEAGNAAAFAYMPVDNMAIKATNDLLARGVPLFRAETAFMDEDRPFGAGTFVLHDGDGVRAIAGELANQYGLDLYSLSTIPEGLTPMYRQRIAVPSDASEGLRFALTEMGFGYDLVDVNALNAGVIADYDVLVNDYLWWTDLDAAGQAAVTAFLVGGGDYVGIGRNGVRFADVGGLMDFDYETGSRRWNGVLEVDYDPADAISAYYPAESHGFVYRPVWFTDYGAGVDVSASIDEGEFFVSGYWPTWDTDGAAGQPVVLHEGNGASEVVLMGIEPTFRAHPEHTFRLVANAIYTGLQ